MNNRPNILIIQSDQHRIDCIGAYGNSEIQTPHLDALSADGIRYQQSFCPYPVCTPSRYSFLSGLYVHQHMGRSNRSTLSPVIPTFPRVLCDAGYQTKAVGKMHFTPTYLDVGFEEMLLAEQAGSGRYDDDYHRWLKEEGQFDQIDLIDQVQEYRQQTSAEYWDTVGAIESNLEEKYHSTTWIGDCAVESLSDWNHDRSHLLMVSFIKPHHPFDPPTPWSRMYDLNRLSLLPGYTDSPLQHDLDFHAGFFPYAEMTEEKIRGAMAYYYATISQIDHHLGRLIDCLKQKDLYDNTLILYNSDHGEYMGYHHLLLKGNYMYDPLIKVPLIIKYPDQTQAGTVSDALVNTIDAAPTLLKQTSCQVPETMMGLDLMDSADQREFVFAEAGRGSGYMARSKTRKLLLHHQENQSQFFDLEMDPYELNNLFFDPHWQDEVAAFREALFKWAMFDHPTHAYLDPTSAIIPARNAVHHDDGHRDEIYAYFKNKMKGNA
ncbi:TPA: hypothetical protein EYN98_14185 [Candidatus Poribacteria bacterium]|nr:hypothetical protein [Candidatus Poribacteria bacterium]HIB85912.1 hypothetical protein [Candidatus Poribacteria bacterium]HIB99211.1 hypothetical protein [Candidatus Poribacteria bacterium]HIM10036.1 hypothetical protein [Candidatus Poribacteria bacterium]HIN30411.1 hypothetical protein [Candidatus Poribacteria bacterium]